LPANATAVTNTILDAGTDRRVKAGIPNSVRWSQSWGVLTGGYVRQPVGDTGLSTLTDLTGLSLSVTLVTGRLYRVTVQLYVLQNTSAGTVTIQVRTGTSGAGVTPTPVGMIGATPNIPAGVSAGVSVVGFMTGSGASSFHVRGSTTAGTFDTLGATGGCWFVIEDVGPS
jgi:hypothetical protein